MDKVEFRKARIDDLPAIIALLSEDAMARVGEIVSDPPAPEYLRAFQEIEADPNNELVVELLPHAFGRAQERGCGVIQLTSNKARINASRFYKTLGFENTHEGMKKTL